MSANIVTLTNTNFDDAIKQEGSPILVDFWAEWCGPCRMVTPILEKLADEYVGKARIGKVNVDEHSSLAAKFGVQSIPTLLLFKYGEVTDRTIGALPKAALEQFLDRNL